MLSERVRLIGAPKGDEDLGRKRLSPEQIIAFLREVEVCLSQGEKIGVICRGLGVSEQSYYRWRREYGGVRG
jgi:putative transposase